MIGVSEIAWCKGVSKWSSHFSFQFEGLCKSASKNCHLIFSSKHLLLEMALRSSAIPSSSKCRRRVKAIPSAATNANLESLCASALANITAHSPSPLPPASFHISALCRGRARPANVLCFRSLHAPPYFHKYILCEDASKAHAGGHRQSRARRVTRRCAV